VSNSLLDLGNTAELTNALETFQILPMKLLEGDVPRLIDEWQTIPDIWDMIRSEVDKRGEMGQFVLTGSSVPVEEDKRRHSGNGRYGWIDMRPMSLWESGESSGKISISNLFDGKSFDPFEYSMDLEKLAFIVCRGGATFVANMKKVSDIDRMIM